VILTDSPEPLHPGQFVRATIDEAHTHDLIGRAVEVSPVGSVT